MNHRKASVPQCGGPPPGRANIFIYSLNLLRGAAQLLFRDASSIRAQLMLSWGSHFIENFIKMKTVINGTTGRERCSIGVAFFPSFLPYSSFPAFLFFLICESLLISFLVLLAFWPVYPLIPSPPSSPSIFSVILVLLSYCFTLPFLSCIYPLALVSCLLGSFPHPVCFSASLRCIAWVHVLVHHIAVPSLSSRIFLSQFLMTHQFRCAL